MRHLSGNGPHLARKGEPPRFSQVASGALSLPRGTQGPALGTQGPALVASGKASPHASCSGTSRDSSPVDAGAQDLVWSRSRRLRLLTWTLGYFWSLLRAVSPRLEWGHARALSSRGAVAVSRFPSRGSRDLWLSLDSFPRRFPTRLSHRAVPRATNV